MRFLRKMVQFSGVIFGFVVHFRRLLSAVFLSSLIPVCAFADQSPYGWLDAVNFDANAHKLTASGWALDPDTSASIAVHFYMSGPAGGSVFVGAVAANLPRADVNSATSVPGNHGFLFETTLSCSGGQALYAYAIDASGSGNNPLIGGSPKSFTCSQVPPSHSSPVHN